MEIVIVASEFYHWHILARLWSSTRESMHANAGMGFAAVCGLAESSFL